jgi:hypothetical protein
MSYLELKAPSSEAALYDIADDFYTMDLFNT